MKALLLHGALGNSSSLEGLAHELESLGFEPTILEFIGHGKEPHHPDVSVQDLVDQLRDALTAFDFPVPVFGYSMGGYVALTALIQGEVRITSLTTLGTKLAWDQETASKETRGLDHDFLMERAPAYVEGLQHAFGQNYPGILKVTSDIMNELGREPRVTPDSVGEIGIPVQMWRGTEDKMVTLDETRTIADSIPAARCQEMQGWKHMLSKVPADQLASELAKSWRTSNVSI